MKKLLATLLAASTLALGGCASSTNPTPGPAPAPTPIAMPSSTVTGGITLLTAAGITAGLDFGISNATTRTKIGGDVYTGATLVLQLANGTPQTPQQLQSYLTQYGVQNDADYASIASTIVSLYDEFVYPKIAAGGNAAAVDAYVTAFASGLQNGAAVYAPETVLPASTLANLQLKSFRHR